MLREDNILGLEVIFTRSIFERAPGASRYDTRPAGGCQGFTKKTTKKEQNPP